MKKALIYCRVSSDRQVNEGHGLDSQEKRCRDFAISNGYEISKVFAEEGISGGLFERPAMRRLLEYIDKHIEEQYVVIFDDIKRLARDTQIHFKLRSEIYGRGCTLASPNFKFEDSPEGKFVETVMAAQSELERNQNKRQVIQKMKARLDSGYWSFNPPPGLINVKDPLHGKILVPREPYATIFKEAIEKYADSELNTLEEVRSFIVEQYASQSLKVKLSINGTFNILTEELYCGYIQYKPWGIPFQKGKHEGFIAYETYQRVQDKLLNHSHPKLRGDFNPLFPLRGLILCSKCNKPMTGSRNKGRDKYYPNYWCKTKGCERNYKVVRANKVHEDFERLLSDISPPEEVVSLTKRIVMDLWNNKEKVETRELEIKKNRIHTLQNMIEKTSDKLIKTDSDDLREIYEKKIKELIADKKTLEQNLSNRPSFSKEKLGTVIDAVLNILSKPLLMWKSDDKEVRKTIIYMYFDKRPAYDIQEGFGTNNLALPIKLMRTLSEGQLKRVEMPGIGPGSGETPLQTFSER